MPTRCSSEVERSGVLGRGGAASRWLSRCARCATPDAVAATPCVVANGEEGEPASIKDRWLLRHRPHLVLDGLRLAARIVGARHAYVYVSDPRPPPRRSDRPSASSTPRRSDGVAVSVRHCRPRTTSPARRPPRCVSSTADRPNRPTNRRARSKRASAGLPTLVSNVETLANLPYLQRHGAEAFRAVGTGDVAGHVPGDASPAAGAAAGALRDSARHTVRRVCSRCTGCPPSGCAAR